MGTADLFPVNRILCVRRNYADHAREIGHDPDREPPFSFLKPGRLYCRKAGIFHIRLLRKTLLTNSNSSRRLAKAVRTYPYTRR